MKIQVLDRENKVSGDIDLSDSVFGIAPRRDIITRVILWQLAKRRSGNHATKSKSDVHGTNKKMYRQKGTGGARHGTKRAAQFRGGGIIFGPVVRSHEFCLTKKVKKLGLKMALSSKALSGDLIVVDNFDFSEKLKTKDFLGIFPGMANVLFVDSVKNDNLLKAMSNLIGFDFVPQIGANVYDIVRKSKLVLSVSAIKELEGRLS